MLLCSYVWDAAVLEGNPFTYPEVQTLLEGITVGGRKLSDERQILNLSESANELIRLVRSGEFRIDESTSDLLNGLIAVGEALEAGHFRRKGSVVTSVSVNTEMIDFYWQKDGTRMFQFLASPGSGWYRSAGNRGGGVRIFTIQPRSVRPRRGCPGGGNDL